MTGRGGWEPVAPPVPTTWEHPPPAEIAAVRRAVLARTGSCPCGGVVDGAGRHEPGCPAGSRPPAAVAAGAAELSRAS